MRMSTVVFGLGLLGLLGAAGCSTGAASVGSQVYDFGPALAKSVPYGPAQHTTIVVEPVSAAQWLDSPAIVFRLQYADVLEARHYANSEWSAPPAELMTQRLEARLAEKVSVAAIGDAPGNAILKVELGEFAQVFDSEGSSHVIVEARATLFKSGRLISQRSFTLENPAPTANARGAAHALAQTAEQAIDAIVQWTVPLL